MNQQGLVHMKKMHKGLRGEEEQGIPAPGSGPCTAPLANRQMSFKTYHSSSLLGTHVTQSHQPEAPQIGSWLPALGRHTWGDTF